MRKSQWFISLLLATSLWTAAAVAAEAATAPVQSPAKEATLEKIDSTPASENGMKDCPVNHKKEQCKHDKKDCSHKNGEPCPYGDEAKQRVNSPEKCDYKKRG